jgi:hypothetical protein
MNSKTSVSKSVGIILVELAAVAMVGCGNLFKGKGAAQTAISDFHSLFNQGDFDGIWTNACMVFVCEWLSKKSIGTQYYQLPGFYLS